LGINNKKIKIQKQKGITLIEVIVCVTIFAILSASIYGFFTTVLSGIIHYREKTVISSLADQYLEIAKNMPYSQIGTLSGNPHGTLADLANPISTTIAGINYQIYYAVSFVDDPADGTFLAGTDSAPRDYKHIKLYVKNISTDVTNSFLTTIAPKGLEGITEGGALSLEVFDAVGQPVPGAKVHITNNNITPNIDLTRTVDANGKWIEIGLPNDVSEYNVVAYKTDYSTDQTHPISLQNPNPTKPDATISDGQITQVSFFIDQLSNLTFKALTRSCGEIANTGLQVIGSKLIGTSPDVYKFNNTYTTDSAGQISLTNIEWDNYTPILTGTNYMIYGSSPIQQVSVLPNTTQNFNLILGPKTTNSLLVVVKDSSTNNPIEAAEVILQKDGNTFSGTTSGSVWSQQDWSDGSYEEINNIDTNTVPLGLRLTKVGSTYVSSGFLTSSAFDTGTNLTSYTTITWQPTSQDPSTEIKFQIATNNDNSTWNFLGPDGTDQTFYTVSGSTISNLQHNRYIKYKVFLSTTDDSKTPVLTGVNINYVSGCSTPGQVMFPGLEEASNYNVTVNMQGYQSQTIENINIEGYKVLQVLLSH